MRDTPFMPRGLLIAWILIAFGGFFAVFAGAVVHSDSVAVVGFIVVVGAGGAAIPVIHRYERQQQQSRADRQ